MFFANELFFQILIFFVKAIAVYVPEVLKKLMLDSLLWFDIEDD